MLALNQINYRGLSAWQLQNQFVSLIVVPERGGKMVSLRSKVSGKEWLYNSEPASMPLRCPNYGDSFVKHYDTGGWDECFPSICQEEYPSSNPSSLTIPDHGVLWCLPWQVVNVRSSPTSIGLMLECTHQSFGVIFQRTIWLDNYSSQISIDYQVVNLGTDPKPFIWSAHPIFKGDELMQICFLSGINKLKTDSSFQSFYQTQQPWVSTQPGASHQQSEHFLRPSPLNRGLATKLYSPPLTQSMHPIHVALRSGIANEQLNMTFKGDCISHFGLWLNYQGWSGNDNPAPLVIGLEPCIGGDDSLGKSMAMNQVGQLEPKDIYGRSR